MRDKELMNLYEALLAECPYKEDVKWTSFNPEDFNALHEYVEFRKPSSCLEIGYAYGVSARIIAKLMEVGKLYSVDPFVKELILDRDRGIKTFDSSPNVVFSLLEQESAIALPSFLQAGSAFDFIFIDGSHLFAEKFIDVYWSNRLIAKGGYVAIHDSWLPQTMQINSYIKNNFGTWRLLFRSFTLSIYKVEKQAEFTTWWQHNIF
jgi:predicted O-methyltransferase YrrM